MSKQRRQQHPTGVTEMLALTQVHGINAVFAGTDEGALIMRSVDFVFLTRVERPDQHGRPLFELAAFDLSTQRVVNEDPAFLGLTRANGGDLSSFLPRAAERRAELLQMQARAAAEQTTTAPLSEGLH